MNQTITIEDVMAQAAVKAGLEPDQAHAVMVGALGLLEKHAEVEPRDAFYDAVPGAAALARSPEAKPRGGGLMRSEERRVGKECV